MYSAKYIFSVITLKISRSLGLLFTNYLLNKTDCNLKFSLIIKKL